MAVPIIPYRATDPHSVEHVRGQQLEAIKVGIAETMESVGMLHDEGTEEFNAAVYAELWHNVMPDVRKAVGDDVFAEFCDGADWQERAGYVAQELVGLLVVPQDIGRQRDTQERVERAGVAMAGPVGTGKSKSQIISDRAAAAYAKLRECFAIDQAKLASDTGISVSTLHNYMKGKTAPRIKRHQAKHLAATCDFLAGQLRLAADEFQAPSLDPNVKE